MNWRRTNPLFGELCPILEDTLEQIETFHRANPRPYALTPDVIAAYVSDMMFRRKNETLLFRLESCCLNGYQSHPHDSFTVQRMSEQWYLRCPKRPVFKVTSDPHPDAVIIHGVDWKYVAAVREKARLCADQYYESLTIGRRYQAAAIPDKEPLALQLIAAKKKLSTLVVDLMSLRPDYAAERADAEAQVKKLGGRRASIEVDAATPYLRVLDERTIATWQHYTVVDDY